MQQNFARGRGGRGMSDTVLTEVRGGVLRLVLNRPDRLNAFNETMHLALRAGLERARDDDAIRAVLLTGAGRGFCAGQDLGDRDPARETPDLSATLKTFYHPNLRLIRDLPKPVICAVNGVAAGAGANIALACDIVLAARSARFIQAFSRIGLVPDAGGAFTLTRTLGEARAKALTMLAEPLGAETAAEWGLIWQAVDDDALMDQAGALAERLAAGATFGLGLTKALIHSAGQSDFETALAAEAEAQGRAGRSADYAEGVTAFKAKRAPDFQGR